MTTTSAREGMGGEMSDLEHLTNEERECAAQVDDAWFGCANLADLRVMNADALILARALNDARTELARVEAERDAAVAKVEAVREILEAVAGGECSSVIQGFDERECAESLPPSPCLRCRAIAALDKPATDEE